MNFLAFILIALPAAQDFQHQSIRLVVRKSEYALSVFRGDSLLTTYQIAVGQNSGEKQRPGDKRTPVGEFTISQIQNSGTWVRDFGDGKGHVPGAYGPWFLRLKTPGWTGIGIHGTHDPSSLGTMATEGCIRLSNENIAELKKLVTIGTPVAISP
ncbi:MAG: L,D-transpeptidase [Bacteroidota bacterium]